MLTLLGAVTDTAFLATEDPTGDPLSGAIDHLLTNPVIIGLAALGLVSLAVWGVFKTLLSRLNPRAEQTVRSMVGGEPVLEVTTRTDNKEDFLASNSGTQVIQSHYESFINDQSKVIKDQGEIISTYREERAQDRNRLDVLDSKVNSLQDALSAKDRVIESKEAEIEILKETIRLLRADRDAMLVERSNNQAKIDQLQEQLHQLQEEVARLKTLTN